MLRVLVEGWLHYPHSYSLVNIRQLLALQRKEHIVLYVKELPPYRDEWHPVDVNMILNDDERQALKSIPLWNGEEVDVVYRIAYPYDVSLPLRDASSNCGEGENILPLVLFYTSEFGLLKDEHIVNGSVRTFVDRCFSHRIFPVTPSKWSAESLRRHKFDPLVVPHGVDLDKFHPLDDGSRERFRKEYDIPESAFVFLNVGAMTGNKNVRLILKSFYRTCMLRNDVYLVLKGIGDLYSCHKNLNDTLLQLVADGSVTKKRWKALSPRLLFIDEMYSTKDLCILYNACDCYLSPYVGEGFNLPVLEAIATGLPVIVSKGGSTDDFTDDRVAKYPKTYQCKSEVNVRSSSRETYLLVDEGSLIENMLDVIQDRAFRKSAKSYGPQWASRYTWDTVTDKLYNFFRYLTPDIMPNMTSSCHRDLACTS